MSEYLVNLLIQYLTKNLPPTITTNSRDASASKKHDVKIISFENYLLEKKQGEKLHWGYVVCCFTDSR